MRPARFLVAVEIALLVAAGIVAALLPTAPFFVADFFWFVVGLSVLKLSDVWLPRGDTVGMSAALALGALLLFDARVVLAVLVVAEVLALVPPGRGRKWRLALGALTAEALSAVTCSGLLILLRLHPSEDLLMRGGARLLDSQYAYVLCVGLLFAALEYVLLQVESAFRDGRPIAASVLGSLSYGGWLIAAQGSAGVLAALTYRTMGGWGLIVSVVMILVMRQSFVLLVEIRQAYDATISALVKAMEAQSPGREGVAARNADRCVAVGRVLGMHGGELERVRYAALLLGLGTDEYAGGSDTIPPGSSAIIENVEFLHDVAPILRICDSPHEALSAHRNDLTCAFLVAAIAATNETYPLELLERLRERTSPRIVREVDEALTASIAGESYRKGGAREARGG